MQETKENETLALDKINELVNSSKEIRSAALEPHRKQVERGKAPTEIKGEQVRTLAGSIHDGTRSFQKRVLKGRAAARKARKARRRQRSRG